MKKIRVRMQNQHKQLGHPLGNTKTSKKCVCVFVNVINLKIV